MPPPAKTQDRREFGRRETCLRGEAIIGKSKVVHCVVRNISDQGALLEPNEPLGSALVFRLVIKSKRIDTFCEVRHHGSRGVGVRFISDAAARDYRQPEALEPLPAPAPSAAPSSGVELRQALFGSDADKGQDPALPVREYRAPPQKFIRNW